ncbi:pseudouridine synthase [Longibaculum muris]|uniref:pseudouridine synthase n=2 Tax=Longibaculum muris TaxID=1796628 RepID=UPI0022DEB727|nr:16S rRNA pseudouridine(516) synthase [Longibaculum muris]
MITFVQMIVGEEEILIKPLYLILMKNQLGNVKQCRTLIKHGHVHVNEDIISDIDFQVNEDDVIKVDGQVIDTNVFVYYMMNKPKGYICANHDKQYPCVIDLIDRKDCYCVGRLDKDTTGFLLLTNDASLSKALLLPDYHVEKTYLVTVLKPLKEQLIDLFKEGIVIDQKIRCQSARLEIIDDFHCYVTIHEGRYHQVKKMFLSCGNQVTALKRMSFAGILLDEQLKEGQYRQLTKREFQKMKEVQKKYF